MHPAAAFTVTAVGETVLETRITGLTRSLDPDRSATRTAIKAAFELASHYNRVNLAFPARTRFIHQILAAYLDGTLYGAFVGVMVGDGQPWPGPHPTPPQPAPESHRGTSQVDRGQA